MSGGGAESDLTGSTSASLLARVKSDDPDASARLTQIYAPLVYQWVRRRKLKDEDAADIVQDVFQAVFGKVGDFESRGGGFRGWLRRITENKINDYFRHETGQPKAAGGTNARGFLENAPDGHAENHGEQDEESETGELVHRALRVIEGDFSADTWLAFERVRLDGVPVPNVADELGKSTGAIHMANSRVLARLRQELEGLLEL